MVDAFTTSSLASTFGEQPGIPAGRWAVGVSGGADSVALLRLALAARSPCDLHVVHLDHQLREEASSADAEFVRTLASSFGVTFTIATRTEMEADGSALRSAPSNPSAKYRNLRLALFRRVVQANGLDGLLLAHHADDQAETILLRLLRGAGYSALAGMDAVTEMAGLTICRPLLEVRRDTLRQHLTTIDQPWREDESNAGDDYARNRVRKVLADRPDLVATLLALGKASRAARDWVGRTCPTLADEFPIAPIADLPDVMAAAAVAHWLRRRGVSADVVAPAHVRAVVDMCRDAASPARHALPGGRLAWRRKGRVSLV